MTGRRNIEKFCKSLHHSEQLSTPPVLHGRMYETVAIRQFEKESGLSVQKCGLCIDPQHPYLAASPDGLVGNTQTVEVKCPYSGRNSMIQPGPNFPYLELVNDELVLKNNHKYYDQVQGQLFITKNTECFFIVYTFIDMKIMRVQYNTDYVQHSLLLNCSISMKSTFDLM